MASVCLRCGSEELRAPSAVDGTAPFEAFAGGGVMDLGRVVCSDCGWRGIPLETDDPIKVGGAIRASRAHAGKG